MGRKGFTLAEILITLTVIGIVAALTIPTLLQNTNQAELKTALKREFADLQQATLLIKNDNGGSLVNAFRNSTGDLKDSENLKNAYKAKLSYIKECSGDPTYGGSGTGASAEGCWHVQWKKLNGTSINPMNYPGLILSNGTLMWFYIYSSTCSFSSGAYYRCGGIYFDINGFKQPNVIGKDIFIVYVTDDELIPAGARSYCVPDDPDCGCLPTAEGYGCTAKYLYE